MISWSAIAPRLRGTLALPGWPARRGYGRYRRQFALLPPAPSLARLRGEFVRLVFAGSELPSLAAGPMLRFGRRRDVRGGEIATLLQPVRWTLWAQRGLTLFLRVLLFGLVATFLWALLYLVVGEPTWRDAVWLPALGAAVLGLLLAFAQDVTTADAARFVDRKLNLYARLATALELQAGGATTPHAQAQIEDATMRARRAWLSSTCSVHLPGRDTLLALSFTLATAATVALGVGLHQGEDRARLISDTMVREGRKLTAASSQLEKAIDRQQGSGVERRRQAAEQLSQVARDLATRRVTAEEGLASLREAEAALRREAVALNNQEAALDQLGRSLASTLDAQAVAESLRRGRLDDAAAQLQELAQEAGGLSAERRQSLAQALQEAAQNMTGEGNAGLQSAAESAARALQDESTTQDDQRALAALAQAMQDASKALGTREELDSARQQAHQSAGALSEALGEEMQPSMPGMSMPGEAGQEGDRRAGGDPNNPEGRPGASSSGEEGAAGASTSEFDSNAPSRMQGKTGAGSGPGEGLSDTPAEPIDTAGQTLELRGPVLDPSTGRVRELAGQASVLEGSGGSSVSGGAAGEAALGSSADTRHVPWYLRGFVRDYFDGAGR